MFYERLTKRGEDHTLHVFDINDHEIPLSEVTALDIELIAGHLVFLEDKIESGEIVNRNDYLDHLMSAKSVCELTNKEIDFFVKHNARIRKFMSDDLARLVAENQQLKEEAAKTKSVIEHKHSSITEWYRIACYYKRELDLIQRRLETVMKLPHLENEE